MLTRRALAHVGVGTAVGIVYAFVDRVLDGMLGAGTLSGTLELVHELVVSLGLPVSAGACLGLVTYFWRERALAAGRAQHRAESLHTRLARVERDQAVWVMAAAVLHEVRNPLHSLGLLIDEGLAGVPDPDLFVRARGQVDRIAQHVQTLRDLPRAGDPRLERCDLSELVNLVMQDRVTMLRELEARWLLSCEVPSPVTCDPVYARVIIENLVDNGLLAVRGSRERELHLVLEPHGDRTTLRVRDTGVGIAGDPQSFFEPLRTTRAGGLGLGLPIARALARAMGGDVTVEPSERGASFVLELPSGGAT